MERIFVLLRSPGSATAVLLGATLIALIVANSPLATQYMSLVNLKLGPLTTMEWVNDALMAIFFLFVGLEVKRELVSGELNTNAKRIMPGIAALFGVLVPAIIYYLMAGFSEVYIHGWAIPTATDIAFAIGVITALGSRVPNSMKVFLTALAVIDDLIAIVVIALFYGAGVNFMDLIAAAAVTGLLVYTNKQGYLRPLPYCVLGLVLWYLVLKSGVHATIAGVVLAMTIPFKGKVLDGIVLDGKVLDKVVYPMEEWAHALKNWVNFFIIPLFSFLNAGVSFADFSMENLFHPVIIGVSLGLILGKQLGIFSAVYILVQSKAIKMPTNTTWPEIYGTAILCGIGFTMSLFVATLAFPPGITQEMAKVGIFIGSIVAGLLGAVVLTLAYQIRKMRGKI